MKLFKFAATADFLGMIDLPDEESVPVRVPCFLTGMLGAEDEDEARENLLDPSTWIDWHVEQDSETEVLAADRETLRPAVGKWELPDALWMAPETLQFVDPDPDVDYVAPWQDNWLNYISGAPNHLIVSMHPEPCWECCSIRMGGQSSVLLIDRNSTEEENAAMISCQIPADPAASEEAREELCAILAHIFSTDTLREGLLQMLPSLQSITFGSALMEVDERAFAGLPELERVVFGPETFIFGKELFDGCPNLKQIVLDEVQEERFLQSNPASARISLRPVAVAPYGWNLSTVPDAHF